MLAVGRTTLTFVGPLAGTERSTAAGFGVAELPQRQKRARLAERALEEGVVRPQDLRDPS